MLFFLVMWFLLGITSALFDAGRNLLTKQNLKAHKVHSIVISWATVFFALPITLPLFFLKPFPQVTDTFVVAAGLAIALDAISLFLYVDAIKKTDLSLCLPMLAFVPLFLLGTGYIVSGEKPALLGYLGVLLVMIGAYLLNYDPRKSQWYDPLLAIFHNQGTALMFAVAFMWAVSSALHKVAIEQTNVFFYTATNGLVTTIIITLLALWIDPKGLRESFQMPKLGRLLPIGLFDGVAVLAQFLCQSMTLSVFALSLKRTSIVWSSLGGAVLFKEKINKRLVPILIMLGGVIAIAASKV